MSGHRHPICGHTHGTRVKDGPSALHAMAMSAAQGHVCVARRCMPLQTLVFDGEMLDRLFRSTAYSIALARNIKVRPMRSEPKDSAAVKFFVAVLPDRYLTREIDLPEDSVLQKEATNGANEFGEIFWRELDERGVAGAKAFIVDLEAQRENALDKVAKTYREASDYNQGAQQSQENLRHGLIAVKCISTIIVAGITLPFIPVAAASMGWAAAGTIGGLTGFGIGTGYSVSLELIKNWDKAEGADLVMVAGDKAGIKSGQKLAKEDSKFMRKVYESESQGLKKAEETLAGKHWLVKRIEAAEDAAEKAKVIRRLDRARIGAQAVKNAGRLASALKTVPYLFFAWSAKGALVDAYDQW